MSIEQARYHLQKIKNRIILIQLMESLLFSIAIGFVIFSTLGIFPVSDWLLILSTVFAVLVAFLIISYSWNTFRISEKDILRYLDQNFSEFEFSASLLLSTEHNNQLVRLQQNKILTVFTNRINEIHFPNQLHKSGLYFLAGLLLVLIVRWSGFTVNYSEVNSTKTIKPLISSPAPNHAVLNLVEIRITPPAYTGLKSFTTSSSNLTVPEGSKIHWTLSSSGMVTEPKVTFSGTDTVTLKPQGDLFFVAGIFTASGFYQFSWKSMDSLLSSNFFKIEIIPDRQPEIRVIDLPQFQEFDHTEKTTVKLQASITDDYGISESYIIATISKGSGESVKFREEKMLFTSPSSLKGKNINASREFDLMKMGMEPGDELYFYIEAYDNKPGVPNKIRTDTYFIALRDTAEENYSSDATLGVDLMPEYFRSQRQIIIDSEKLIKDKKKIKKEEFNFKSNELGYDQKVLRLRYGQFLGEEFESELTPANSEESHDHEGDDEEEDVVKKFGHVHDQEGEHEHSAALPENHDHQHSKNPDEKEDPLAEFVHAHDDTEQATFFVKTIKAKLRAALTVMWDAELYLRLYEPEKSLPYQYQALEYLNQIRTDSRIYVHRIGFDPPPIKEERRLTGELKDISNTTHSDEVSRTPDLPGIRKAIQHIETMLNQPDKALTQQQRIDIQSAGNELATLAIEKPGEYLESLTLLKRLLDGTIPEDLFKSALKKIRKTFWSAFPETNPVPAIKSKTLHPLDKEVIHQLNKSGS